MFSTKLIEFGQRDGIVESLIEDLVTRQRLLIRSRYLFGADGASSVVARSLNLDFVSKPAGSLSINVEFEADLSHLMKHKPGIIHILTRPDKPQPEWGIAAILRSIRPWHQWTMVLMCHPSVLTQRLDIPVTDMMARIREFIGDETTELKYKQHTFWRVYERYAKQYGHGDMYCLGDAVHQHPPYNGLGANTCIQDAFNLAWKVAFILQGKADASLMSSYSDERQPIGQHTVQRANDTGRMFQKLFGVLGAFKPEPAERLARLDLFKANTEEGEAARLEFRECRYDMEEELNCLGSEMNQWYQSSAVHTSDERVGDAPAWPTTMRERSLNYIESTYPGFRVPHVWLMALKTAPGSGGALISTRDLCGHGRFVILTGIGGRETWYNAARRVDDKLSVQVQVYSIGWGQDYEDTFGDWYRKRDVEEKGAVLVRPDRTVAWRCKNVSDDHNIDQKLVSIMRSVLDFRS